MKTVQVSELDENQLDWAIQQCTGFVALPFDQFIDVFEIQLNSTPYSEGKGWYAQVMGSRIIMYGKTPRIAAYRAYIQWSFGDEVEVSEELA